MEAVLEAKLESLEAQLRVLKENNAILRWPLVIYTTKIEIGAQRPQRSLFAQPTLGTNYNSDIQCSTEN